MNVTNTYEVLNHKSAPELVRWDGHMSDGIGTTNGVPLAFLSATGDELLLCGNRGSFRLPRTAIRKIGRGRFYPWMFRGIRIEHEVRNCPGELQFKPVGTPPSELLQRLKAMNYPVG